MAGKIGYIQYGLKEREVSKQVSRLIMYGCSQVIVEDKSGNKLKQLLADQAVGNQLVVSQLSSLEKTSRELIVFLESLKKQQMTFHTLDSYLNRDETNTEKLLELLKEFVCLDESAIKNRRKHMKNTTINHEIGRPSITPGLVNDILDYHHNQKLSYRQISELTNVSLGTIHKYIKKFSNQSLKN